MAIATKSEARAALGPHHQMIRQIIDDAWAECRAMQALRLGRV